MIAAGMMPTGPGQWVWAWVPSSVPPFPPTMPLSPMPPAMDPAVALPTEPVQPVYEDIVVDDSPNKEVPKEEEKQPEGIAKENLQKKQWVPEPEEKKGVTIPPKRKLEFWPEHPTAKQRAGPRPPSCIPPPHLQQQMIPVMTSKPVESPSGWESSSWGNNQWHSREWYTAGSTSESSDHRTWKQWDQSDQ